MNDNTLRVLNFSGRIAYSNYEIVEHVYKMALELSINNIPGCFVECGVAAGSKIVAMAQGIIDSGSNETRDLYAYDSFEGIPLATQGDNQQPGVKILTKEEILELPEANDYNQFLRSSGATVHGLEDFWSNMAKANIGYSLSDPRIEDSTSIRANLNQGISITTVKGWFEYTAKLHNSPIAYLRLDGDMYSATKVCLENLYPQLAIGGILEIDDFVLAGCSKAVDEYFEGQDIKWVKVHPNSTVFYMHKT